MQTCTVKLSFCSAKRLVSFEGKCQFVHGYSHYLEAQFKAKYTGESTENNHMILDFYLIKQKLGQWLDENWDHTILLHEKDRELGDFIAKYTGQKPFYFDNSPTAETLSEYILKEVCPALFTDAIATNIRIYDTQDAWVDSAL